MSELKDYKVYTTMHEGAWGYHYEPNPNKDQSDIELNGEQVYLKKDADKLIAEKDKEILDLIEQVQKERTAKVAYKTSLNTLSNGLDKVHEKIRMLRRTLWIARAERAEARKNYWYVRSVHEGDKNLWSIDGSAVKYIGCIKRKNFEWLKVWSEVEIKCRAEAEEYK